MVGNALDEMKSALTEGTALMYRMCICVQSWSTGVGPAGWEGGMRHGKGRLVWGQGGRVLEKVDCSTGRGDKTRLNTGYGSQARSGGLGRRCG